MSEHQTTFEAYGLSSLYYMYASPI